MYVPSSFLKVWLWESVCTTKPSSKSSEQVRAVINVSSWKAKTLLQQFLCICHRERGYYSQEYMLKLQGERHGIRPHKWYSLFAYYQHRKPISHKLHPNLHKQTCWVGNLRICNINRDFALLLLLPYAKTVKMYSHSPKQENQVSCNVHFLGDWLTNNTQTKKTSIAKCKLQIYLYNGDEW